MNSAAIRFPFIKLIALMLFLGSVSNSQAHNGEAPPKPDKPAAPTIPTFNVEVIRPPRWSWIHWWEANRDLQPEPQSQGSMIRERPISQEMRKQVRESLLATLEEAAQSQEERASSTRGTKAQRAALDFQDARVRSAALMALGRMGDPEDVEIIADFARNDPDESVRRTAIVALGLTGAPEAEQLLIEDRELRGDTLDVRTAALGLMERIRRPSIARLQKTVVTKDANLGSLATWALNNRNEPTTLAMFQRILRESPSVWLASDALLSMGHTCRPEAIPLLAELLLDGPGAQKIAAYRLLSQRQGMINQGHRYQATTEQKVRRDYEAALRQHQQSGGTGPPPPAPQVLPGPTVTSGVEWTHASSLRGSAAMALGMIDHPKSREALLRALTLPDDHYSELYKGHALISLGKIGDGQCLDALLAFLSARGPYQKYYDSPLRGYAAIGLGLYAQRNAQALPGAQASDAEPHGTSRRPGARSQTSQPAEETEEAGSADSEQPLFAVALAALSDRMLDPRELVETRTACALALGLTGRPEALPPLQALAKLVRPGDGTIPGYSPLVGYSLLARGMLHDHTIIEQARAFLTVTSNRTDMNALLGQRAAILGLGLLDNQDAIPVLQDAWHLNYYASREVILALSLSRSTNAGEILLDLLEQSEDPMERAYISLCLGEVFGKTEQSPLTRFFSDTNYTIRNKNLQPYQEFANDFLTNYLMGAFGDEWR